MTSLAYALTPENFGVVLTMLIGVTFGSFGTVLLARLPHGESIMGRSRCPQCKHTLRATELFPVLSYLWLRGRCGHCGAKISPFYVWAELGSAFFFLLALWDVGIFSAQSVLLGIIFWLLYLIALSDARSGLISDGLNVPFILLAFLYVFSAGTVMFSGVVLALVIFGGQWAVSGGRWVGSGDILLTVGIGAFLGTWQMTLSAFCMAYIAGALVASVFLVMGKKELRDGMVFGPFLAMAAIVMFVWGGQILPKLLP